MTKVLNERFLVQLALLAVGIALFVATFGVSQNVAAAQSPVFFPRIILGVWIALTLIGLLQDFLKREEAPRVVRLGAVIVFMIATVIYVNLVARFGFALSSVPFAVIALLLFGVRNPLVIAAYAILAPGAIVVLFNHILKMPLPTSPFTHLF